MIADLKPYAAYKDSGLPWLGQVPAHWEVRALKRLCSRSALYGANIPAADYVSSGVRFLRTTDITDEGNLRRGGVFVAEAAAHNYMLADGDLLVSRSGTIGRSFRYRADVHGPCAYAGYLVRFVPKSSVSADYLFHFTKSLAFTDFIRISAVSSTIENVNGDKYANMPVILPPLAEQAAIVRFLDWANGRLERAIRLKRKTIALLNEQKQAIIHRAVTRGLDPDAPLKDSGIPWLGGIPAHWEVRRLKSLCSFVTSGSRGWARYYADNGFVFLRIGNISTTSIDLRLKRISYVLPPHGSEGERTRARPDDILLSITAQIGAVGIVPDGLGEAYVNQHTALIRLRPETSVPRWVAYGLLSHFGKDQCRLMMNGGTKVGLTLDDVRCLYILLPPKDEQVRMVAGIETETRALDTAISRLEREITLLREYRTRLVADVVTGKLDVREAAARLPDEAPLPDAADANVDEADLEPVDGAEDS